MPAFFVHITAMERAAALSEVPRLFATAFERDVGAMRLGSIFVDLPYFDGFPSQVLRHYTKKVRFTHEWGQIFHTRATGSLALKLIEAVRRNHELGRGADRALAFIGGVLSHHAFDRTIHPIVRHHVESDLVQHGGRPSHWHSFCEKYQSLFYHQDLLGHDVMGTPYLDERTQSMPGTSIVNPGLPHQLAGIVSSACLQVHGRAPSAGDLGRWLRWARLYGWLLSSRIGKAEGIRSSDRERRRRYFEEPDFPRQVERATVVTVAALRAAEQALTTRDLDQSARNSFLEVVPDVDISVGC